MELLHQTFQGTPIEGIEPLIDLALDLRWSWNHGLDELWREIDPDLWSATRNPWLVLLAVSRTRLKKLLQDESFRRKLEAVREHRRQAEEQPGWFARAHPATALTSVAYFSMEFMLSESLPIYSGGLGNVAGDQLKAASDLGVPLIAVGLLYQMGYFRQVVDREGVQYALYPYNDPWQLPILPVRDANGEWVRMKIPLLSATIWLRAWQAQVGRVTLYLLDTNDPENPPMHRGITGGLYGGGPEARLEQEIVLGIGGWRLLHTLNLSPEVCHLNEGHAAFAILERARCFMQDHHQTFPVALAATRPGNLFTTHTPVPAGFDCFTQALMERYLGRYAQAGLGISNRELLALGRMNADDPNEPFNMAYLAVRGSGAINGVSRLHGQVSRRIFQILFPRWPQAEVPVGFVTNGVHPATWDSAHADRVWSDACGKGRWLGELDTLEADLNRAPDADLWQMRLSDRKALVDYVHARLARQWADQGADDEAVARAYHIFNPDVLTMGFARRFAAYKRPNLLLHDPKRLVRILTNPQRPVQLVIAGKAHPADLGGQALIKEWIAFIARPEVRSHVVFLNDYDMEMSEHLVQGIDLWINTPRRPWEACGTSGMKILVNGGLNISARDGWWAEAYTPDVGWAIGDGKEPDDDAAQDAAEAEELYTLLEREVIPAFYTRDHNGIPTAWLARMRASMARLAPQFSANRAVREYTEKYYIPGAERYRRFSADQAAVGAQVVAWQKALEQHWPAVRLESVRIEPAGSEWTFETAVYLGDLDPGAVRVELYADAIDDKGPVRQELARDAPLVGTAGGYVYRTRIPMTRALSDYTVRLVPYHPDITVPLVATHILWQR
ncbi:alpha-glucan family phosphorylase [Acidiferrobacter sp.]|uniref:alpha-glucan family phosphorylase n=1 Tax=Acidiferrobacter sp. TaxID=1872107 RepID=UPI00262E17D1|nr:alpha-glucan family phosphorylase [Acidiferrobacter sp.]